MIGKGAVGTCCSEPLRAGHFVALDVSSHGLPGKSGSFFRVQSPSYASGDFSKVTSKNRYPNGTLASGNMDQNLRNLSWLILSHTLILSNDPRLIILFGVPQQVISGFPTLEEVGRFLFFF